MVKVTNHCDNIVWNQWCGMAALKWGICAAGLVSHDFVVGLKSLPESEHQVVAVAAGSSLDSARTFATRHSIPQAYGSYQELAADPQVTLTLYPLPC